MAIDPALIAQRQLRDYDAIFPGSAFSDPQFSLTAAEAYDVQFRVASLRESRGESIAGYKVGCLSEAIRKQLGLHEPVMGHIFASELHRSGDPVSASRFHQLAIEGEFAFRIAEDVPGAAWLSAHLDTAIESVFAVIELHNFVFRAPATTRAQELIANNGMHAGVVLSDRETPLGNPDDLLTETISVVRNGRELGTANGAALPDGPLGSLLFIARKLDEAGKKLRRGHIVLAGSPLPLYPTEAGDRFDVRCRRLGAVSLQVLP